MAKRHPIYTPQPALAAPAMMRVGSDTNFVIPRSLVININTTISQQEPATCFIMYL